MLKNIASIQIQKDATFNSDRKIFNLTPNKSFKYYEQQSSIIFRRIRISLIFHNIFAFTYLKYYFAGAGFSNIPGK